METKYPVPSKQVQDAIDIFIAKRELMAEPIDLDHIFTAKESVYRALEEGRITQGDFRLAMCKLSACYFRFTRDNPVPPKTLSMDEIFGVNNG
jgi:hypothetical protein